MCFVVVVPRFFSFFHKKTPRAHRFDGDDHDDFKSEGKKEKKEKSKAVQGNYLVLPFFPSSRHSAGIFTDELRNVCSYCMTRLDQDQDKGKDYLR